MFVIASKEKLSDRRDTVAFITIILLQLPKSTFIFGSVRFCKNLIHFFDYLRQYLVDYNAYKIFGKYISVYNRRFYEWYFYNDDITVILFNPLKIE